MVFVSLVFLLRFLPLVLLLYYIVPRKYRNLILFVSSLFFYAWGEPVYVLLILFSTIADYTIGRIVSYQKEKGNVGNALLAVFVSVFINLGTLAIFKYTDFFISVINKIPGINIPPAGLALPIGISFYTFQTMSYTIDVYRGDTKAQKNFISFGAYVSLFPQLIAGPIVRYRTVAGQLDHRKETTELFCQGVFRFMAGFGKKVFIANQMGELWDSIRSTDATSLTTPAAWLGAVAFTLQIYFDFSGYSDMAIGMGKMFGFEFLENFDYPYESKSVTEFWRRWHISLGTWFKEYLYIPLGGNKKGMLRQIFNIFAVWLLTGLWHGAAWCFVLWGIYYGVVLVLEKIVLKKILEKIPSILSRVYTLFIVTVGWCIFASLDIRDSNNFIKTLFGMGAGGFADRQTMYLFINYAVILLIGAAGSTSLVKRFVCRILPVNSYRRYIGAMFFITGIFFVGMAFLINSSYNPFLYFRF